MQSMRWCPPSQTVHWRRINNKTSTKPALSNSTPPQPSSSLSISETLRVLMQNPNSAISLLQGYEETLLLQICSYINLATRPCTCCKDQAVAYCCLQHRLMAGTEPIEPEQIYPKEIPPSLVLADYRNENKIIFWAVGVDTYVKRGHHGANFSSSAFHRPETYMVVTSPGFYSGFFNFQWKESVNEYNYFSGYVLDASVNHFAKSRIQFERHKHDDGSVSWSSNIFSTKCRKINKGCHRIIKGQLARKSDGFKCKRKEDRSLPKEQNQSQ